MRVFNLAKELEKERKKNKKLQKVIDNINKTLESSLSNMQKLVAISILLKKEDILEGSDNNE